MRSLWSRDAKVEAGVDSKTTCKINVPDEAMMRSLRSDEETGIADDALLRSLRSYEPSVADAAMMRSLRSSYNPKGRRPLEGLEKQGTEYRRGRVVEVAQVCGQVRHQQAGLDEVP